MPVNSNKLDVPLTTEQVAAIMDALDTLDAALPFIMSLTPEECQRLFRMGTRSEGFVREALTAAQRHPEHLPTSVGGSPTLGRWRHIFCFPRYCSSEHDYLRISFSSALQT